MTKTLNVIRLKGYALIVQTKKIQKMNNTKFNRSNCGSNSRTRFAKFPLDNILDDIFNGDFFGPEFKKTTKSIFNNFGGYPAVNIKETEDSFQIEVIAPGLEKSNFNISLEGEKLIIRSQNMNTSTEGETTEEVKEATPKVKYLRKEFTPASFRRTFNLPENVETEGIKADYEAGILTISLPLKEVEVMKTRTIEVG